MQSIYLQIKEQSFELKQGSVNIRIRSYIQIMFRFRCLTVHIETGFYSAGQNHWITKKSDIVVILFKKNMYAKFT